MGLKMGVNLNKLNISLDQFNAVSSGKYNIGQLKLGEDGASVYRTNNHKTLTFLNTTRISSEESLALKFAFCKALANEGLSSDAIESVKEKLGISGGVIDAVRVGGVTPLSAADVRAIIDEYAETINEKRASKVSGAAALQTSSEIYRGVSEDTLESRATARESVNSRTVEQMMSAADNSVNTLLDMLEYTGEGETETMSPVQKGIAQEILQAVNRLSMGKSIVLGTTTGTSLSLSRARTVVATFRLDNGNTFSIDTGLDRARMLAKMGTVVGGSRTSETEKSEEVSDTLAGDDKEKLLRDLEHKFNLASDEARKKLVEEELRNVPTHSSRGIPLDPKYRETVARDNVRNKLTGIVDPLQKALSKARPHDERNVKLVNQVRDVLAGDKGIDTKDLLKRISDALDTKIVDSREKVAKQLAEGIADELDTNLNIDAWLERS